MNLPVRTTPQFDTQIREIDFWWQANRPAAPDLFFSELTESLALIGNAPLVGRPYRQSHLADVRRVLLSRTRYHIYYVPLQNEIRVLAVWHAQRGVGPPLRDK